MSQLIEQNGKYYKPSDVVILETDRESNIIKAANTNFLTYVEHWSGKHKPQYLYFLSDEEIKEGDWVYHHASNKVFKYDGQGLCVIVKKIIATTDSSLSLGCKTSRCKYGSIRTFNHPCKKECQNLNYIPQPSPEFIQAYIEAYNSGKPITKVLVEYELVNGNKGKSAPIRVQDAVYILKLKDNQIIIKKLEEKMYSKSEVIELLRKAVLNAPKLVSTKYGSYELSSGFDNWLKENLK